MDSATYLGVGLSGSGRLVLGISGASGSRLGVRALALFSASPDVDRLHVVISPGALVVAQGEIDASLRSETDLVDLALGESAFRERIVLHANGDLSAAISSGSFQTRGMAILPCSAGTLASIAHGISRGLLQRAADVCLKERRRLVLGFRETPYSLVHAENILSATRAGAVVAPPVPAFYSVRTEDDMVDAYLLRVADLLDVRIETKDFRWKGGL